ncbi:siderophore-interacting protein [Dietzia sp.]|uniref:siderophore-interacting protein n=1 Tax=Dietzia sp. TaxID=1871616 RepID=UPI002FD96A48
MHVDLEVVSAENPNPAFRRVVFTGEHIEPLLRAKAADAYVKLLFPGVTVRGDSAREKKDHKVKKAKKSEKSTSSHHGKPCTRSYTLAQIDPEARTVTVDFTRHDGGGAGYTWAAAARPGDTITSSLPRGSYSPGKGADAFFVVADTPGLPAARRVIAAAKKPERIRVIVDTTLSEEQLELPKKVHSVTIVDSSEKGSNTRSTESSSLLDALEAAKWPKGTVEIFARGEKTVTKRHIGRLARERGLDRSRASISGYWSAPRSS